MFLIYLFGTSSDAAYTYETGMVSEQFVTAEAFGGQNITLQDENEEAVTWDYLADSLPM